MNAESAAAPLSNVTRRREALAYLKSQARTDVKVADSYDEDAQLREALDVLMPGFEYPDISYLSLAQLHRKCSKTPDPDIVALKEQSLQQP